MLPQSMLDKIDVVDGCWVWTGFLNPKGYGMYWHEGKAWLSHRLAWTLTNGPTESILHHVCQQKACCNPEHLLEVTNAENRFLDRRKICKSGRHSMTGENRAGRGYCRACRNERRRLNYRREKVGSS